MADAKAIVVTESNIILLAGMIAEALGKQRIARDFENLYLDRAARTRAREDGTGNDESGLFYPGLRTSHKNKFQTAELLKNFLAKDRLFWHQNAACYSMPQPHYEVMLTKNQVDLTPAVLWRQLYPTADGAVPGSIQSIQDVLQYHQRDVTTRAMLEQFANISYRPKSKIADNGERIVKYSITGKVKDGDKDDLYMAASIALLGAVWFYKEDDDNNGRLI